MPCLPQVEDHGCGAGLGGKEAEMAAEGRGARQRPGLTGGCRLRPPRPPEDRASLCSAKWKPQLLGLYHRPHRASCLPIPPHPHPCLSWAAGGLHVPSLPPPPTHLSRWSFWARVRQSAPRLQGGSRLVMIFCRMRKGILKALGPTRAGTPPSLSRTSSSANLVSWEWGRMEVPVRTCPAQPTVPGAVGGGTLGPP